MDQFQISARLQSYLKTWPSRVTEDVTEIQDFADPNYPSPRVGEHSNKSTSIYYSKTDGTDFQIYAADSKLSGVVQVSVH